MKKESIITEGINRVSRTEDKKAIIIHGWGASPELHWFPEEKIILESLGYDVSSPLMPAKYSPKKNAWLGVLSDFDPNESDVLIGHSIGGTAILEYLENSDKKVDKVVLVSSPIEYTNALRETGLTGFKLYLENIATDAFLKAYKYEEIYDWEKIRRSANEFILIYKEKDVLVPELHGRFLADKLGAQLIVVPGFDHGHDFDLDLINRELR